MKRKKLILSESSLIDLICKTVLEVSNINEAMEDMVNPIETGQLDDNDARHYANWEPDKGFRKFWHDWSEVDKGNISEEDFTKLHPDSNGTPKTREQYKEDIKGEINSAASDAAEYYKSYYSEKNQEVFEKLKHKDPKFNTYGRDVSIPRTRIHYIHKIMRLIATGGINNPTGTASWHHKPSDYTVWEDISSYNYHTKNLRGGINVWYSCEELNKKGLKEKCDANGWVDDTKTGVLTYNINVFAFSNPSISGWRENIYSTTVHEIGHLMERILRLVAVDPYPSGGVDTHTGLGKGDGPGEGKSPYVLQEWETYARIHQLRRIFDVTTNISAKEWAKLFMDRYKEGKITFVMHNINEDANKRKEFCQKIKTHQQIQEDGTELRVANANDIQYFLKRKGFDIATDGSFGDETAHAVLQYLGINIGGGMVPAGQGGAEEVLRKFMVTNHPIFSDGIGGQSQAIIVDELYKKCKEHQKTWIPPVRFELDNSEKMVIIVISKQLLTQQYSGTHGNADGVPDTFGNIWSITSDLRFNGRKYSDISALFAKFNYDSIKFKCKDCSEDDILIIIDFEKIKEVNDSFVDADLDTLIDPNSKNPEDTLYMLNNPPDSSKT